MTTKIITTSSHYTDEDEIAELRIEQKDFEDERLELRELRQELNNLSRLPAYNFACILANNPWSRFFLKINNDHLFIQREAVRCF